MNENTSKRILPIEYTGRCPTCLNTCAMQPNKQPSFFAYHGEKDEAWTYELCAECAELMKRFFFITMERRRSTKDNIGTAAASLERLCSELPRDISQSILKGINQHENNPNGEGKKGNEKENKKE